MCLFDRESVREGERDGRHGPASGAANPAASGGDPLQLRCSRRFEVSNLARRLPVLPACGTFLEPTHLLFKKLNSCTLVNLEFCLCVFM